MASPFLVGWGSFSKNLTRNNGFKTFFVVDDYTSIGFWNLLYPRLSELPPMRGLEWDVHVICEPIAADSLYRDCGCVRPRFDQQPVIYCVEHGKDVGRYILKATVDEALAFMALEIAGGLEGIAASTILNWQEQDAPDAWETRGGVYCTAVGLRSGKTYGIDYVRFLRQYSVHVNGSRTSQLFKTEEEAKGWALVLEKMDVVTRGY